MTRVPFQDLAPQDGAETSTYVKETFRFLNLPPSWVLALILVPAPGAFAPPARHARAPAEPRPPDTAPPSPHRPPARLGSRHQYRGLQSVACVCDHVGG